MRLLRVPALVRAKPLAWAFLVLVVVFLVTGGKAYYVVGAVPVLLAAGACGLEERWSRRGLVVAGVVLALSAFVVWPAALPVLPERAFGASVYPELNDDQAEMIGWPALVDAVRLGRRRQRGRARRHRELRRGRRARVVRVRRARVQRAQRVRRLGAAGRGPDGPVVLVGYEGAPDWAVGCRDVGRVDNGVDVDNEEQGGAVQVCDGPRGSWADVWDEVRRLDA